MFQEHTLFPWLTIYENIAFSLRARGIYKETASRVDEFIQLVGLAGFEKYYPHQLSGGMCQRASLARALVSHPKVLLLDEPLGALDAFTRMNMQEEILRIRKEQDMTMIMVTHDVDEAVYLSDRIVVMTPRPGRITKLVDVPFHHPRARSSDNFCITMRGAPPAQLWRHHPRTGLLFVKRSKTMKKRILSLLLAASTLALSACGAQPASSARSGASASAGDGSLYHLRIAYSPSLCQAPLHIAVEKGFFEDEGIDAENIQLDAALSEATAPIRWTRLWPGGQVLQPLENGCPLSLLAAIHTAA